jgi:hypothetical protein
MSCAGNNYLGQDSRFVIEFDDTLAATDDPTAATGWKPFGSINSKNYSLTTNTVDNTTDDTGAVASVIATGMAFEVTVSGYQTDADSLVVNQDYLVNWMITKLTANQCPNTWVRIMMPGKTIFAYCFASSNNSGGGSKDTVTFEMAFTATSTHDVTNPAVQIDYTAFVPAP